MTLEQSTGSVLASLFFNDHVTPAMPIMPAMARRLARYSSLLHVLFLLVVRWRWLRWIKCARRVQMPSAHSWRRYYNRPFDNEWLPREAENRTVDSSLANCQIDSRRMVKRRNVQAPAAFEIA
jgi:hypothetical protein